MRISDRLEHLYNGGFPGRAFADNRSAIAGINLRTAKLLSAFSTGLFFVLAAASLAFREISGLFWVYVLAMMFVLALLIIVLLYAPKHTKSALIVMYLGVSATALSAIAMGTILGPDDCSAAFIGVIAALPAQILDKPGRVALLSMVLTALFCVSSWLFKARSIALIDCINAITMCCIGIGIAYHNIKTRMTSIISKAQLQWNESRYKAILNASQDIVFELDPVTRSFYVGERGNGYFGDSMTFDSFVNADHVYYQDRDRYFRILNNVIENGENTEGEIRLVDRDGKAVWFAMHITRLMGSDGRKKRIVGRLTNIDSQKHKEEILKKKSQIDEMTGLFNRAATEENIVRGLQFWGNGCALLVADMDNLKEINDNLGHAEGDEAIKHVAGLLKKYFSAEGDIVGRTGGDEFMMFYSSSESGESLANILSRLFFELNSLRIGENSDWKISVSVGVATCSENCKCFQRLYRMADTALYRVKKFRKNGYAFYDPSMDEALALNGL